MAGFIAYNGPSLLDGSPIVVVVTTGTKNPKTGDMVQTWILRSDVAPTDAIKSGADSAVCGSCPFAGGRGCYVNTAFAPNAIFKAFKAERYPVASPDQIGRIIAGRAVRFGAYGDPAAVPDAAWAPLRAHAAGWTGYTHQWRDERFQALRAWLMASVETDAGYEHAKALGWRTFRVRQDTAPMMSSEIVCPASPEGGNRLSCAECLACDGQPRPGKRDVTIVVHGGKPSLNAANKTLRGLNN